MPASVPKYSVCITHYNCNSTLERSLNSILKQTDANFEIVVVDNKSTDGSELILRRYSNQGKIKLVEKKCSRGRGRQIALENSRGDYIISGLDMDDSFNLSINSLLRFYHSEVEGKLLSGLGEATMIGPRQFLNWVGGWRDLQFRENWELCRRAAQSDSYRWTIFPIVDDINPHTERRKMLSTIKYRYVRYRENLRVGHKQFDQSEKIGLGQNLVWLLTKFSVLFLPKYMVDYPFTAVDPKFYVDSRAYWVSETNQGRGKNLYQQFFLPSSKKKDILPLSESSHE